MGKKRSVVGLALAGLGMICGPGLISCPGASRSSEPAQIKALPPEPTFAFAGDLRNVHLSRPVVGAAATGDGHGYWLVGSDGGVFSFGDAGFYGSTGGIRLAQPIVGMAATPDGRGYWMVAADGGVFSFGDARFYGSAGGGSFRATGLVSTPDGRGYWLASSSGSTLPYGDAASGTPGISNAVAMAPVSGGYITVNSAGWVQVSSAGSTSSGSGLPQPTPKSQPLPNPPTVSIPPGVSPTSWTPPPPDEPLYTWDYPTATFWPAGKTVDWYIAAGAPSYALTEAQTAISEVSAATGLQFHYGGIVSFQPFVDSYVSAPDGIVIGWEPQSVLDAALAASGSGESDLVGLTQPLGEGISATQMNLFKAEVGLDSTMQTGYKIPPGFGPGAVEGNVLLHELGHAMGLGHVTSQTEVMYPAISNLTPNGYGPGDLAGLHLAGEAPSF